MPLSIEQKLPTELLEHVVSLASRDSLRNLCSTSRTLNRLATPCLYSEIYLKETDHLPALAYLVFTSPAHAALVKSFIVPETWAKVEEKFCDWSWPRPEDPELHGVLKAKCVECTSSDKEADRMYGHIRSGEDEDTIMVLLLASLPKLRRLNINFGIMNNQHGHFWYYWPEIMNGLRSRQNSLKDDTRSPAVDAPQVIQVLSLLEPMDIMVTGAECKYSNCAEHLALFFHLPNLRSIYGWKHYDGNGAPDPDDPPSPWAELRPRSCPVEYVELRCARLHMDSIDHLLNATIPGKLKTFSYETSAWDWAEVDHSAIMRSLQPYHKTLEVLSLSHEDSYPYPVGAPYGKNTPYPCSFAPFTALKRLKIAPVYIWGDQKLTDQASLDTPGSKDMFWSALPRNLEELWITRAQNQEQRQRDGITMFVPTYLIPALNLVITNKQKAFPKLQHLRIEFPLLDWNDEWFEDLASFCHIAAAEDIKTTVTLCDMFDRFGPITAERHWGWNEDIEWEPTRYSQNRECAKVWIDATQQEHPAQILKDMKARFEEENERYREAQRRVNSLGPLCRDCIKDPEYDASRGIGLPERFVDTRLQKEPYWMGRGKTPDVVT